MREQAGKQLEKNLYIIGLCLPCVGLMLWMLWQLLPAAAVEMLKVPCIFHTITGLYCPGCGGTRAVKEFLKGNWILSFFYHPIVLYGFLIYFWFMLSHTIEQLSKHRLQIGMRYRDIYLWIALAIVIINTAVKDIALTAFHTDILKILDMMCH